jgi:hypothetical protein
MKTVITGKDPIKKISDLKPGNEYWMCFVRSATISRHCKLIAIINEKKTPYGLTELYLEFRESTNLVFCEEIGIGNTRMEAKRNYGKFRYEEDPSFSDSFSEACEIYHNAKK